MPANRDGLGSLDVDVELGDGQTAFFGRGLLAAAGDDFRIDHHHQLVGFSLIVVIAGIDHEDTAAVGHLGRGQANPRGCIHGLSHIFEMTGEIWPEFFRFHRSGFLGQERVRFFDDV